MPRLKKQTPEEKELYRVGQKNAKGQTICGAKAGSKRGQPKPCGSTVLMPNGRCRVHGGETPRGEESPHFINGKYSRYAKVLAPSLAERYQQSLSDADLVVLRDELALLDVRISQLLQGLTDRESTALWGKLKQSYADLKRARAIDDAAKRGAALAVALTELESLIENGASDSDVWAEIANLLDLRRKLAESERKRLMDLQNVMTAEQAILFLNAVADTIRLHVTDPETLRLIRSGLVNIAHARIGRAVESAASD